jgi:deazaflavin-dependent oxidoreductase (nitroreductase family)
VLTRVHRWGHRRLRGKVGSRYPGRAELVFVNITGRRSGAVHQIPLLAERDGDAADAPWIIAGSNGGQQDEPQWARNLRAQAENDVDASVEAHGTTTAVRVELVTDPAEHQRLYQILIDAWPLFTRYRNRVERTIPVFTLHPHRVDS